jgi:hypothetical protein
MVFHVSHFPMHIVIEPLFQPRGLLFQKFGLGNTAGQKTEAFGFGFNKQGMFMNTFQKGLSFFKSWNLVTNFRINI